MKNTLSILLLLAATSGCSTLGVRVDSAARL